jgi:hypothetical protein
VVLVIGASMLLEGPGAGAQAGDSFLGTLTVTKSLDPGRPEGLPLPDDTEPEVQGDREATGECDASGCTFGFLPFDPFGAALPLTIGFGDTIELEQDVPAQEPDCVAARAGETAPTISLAGDADSFTLTAARDPLFGQSGTCIVDLTGITYVFEGVRQGDGSQDSTTAGSGGPGASEGEPSAEAAALTERQRASIIAVADGDRSVVPASVATPAEAAEGAERTVVNLMLAGLAVLLLVFPSQLFNATWSQHHGRIEAWWARRLGRHGPDPDAPPRNRVGLFALTVVAGAVLAGFLDPNLALDAPSLTLIGGAVVSIAVGSLVLGAAAVVYRSRRGRSTSRVIDAIPSGLVVAAVCVVISRAVGFRPGYLFGLVGGLVFVHALDRAEEGRAELTATIVGLAVALTAWLATIPIGAAANDGDPNLVLQLADAVTAALFVGGIEGLMIGLIPLTALPGANLFAWRRSVWVLAEFAVIFTFLQVLLRPESGYLGASATTSTVVTAALFVGFGLASVAFWGYFRFRPDPAPDATAPPTPVAAGDHWGDDEEAS